uniref:Hydroxyacyl-CoA dehydrogenase trifunctional multienzyme complex subunit alpha b n=1 Tax=Astyanax mexicanus TaxID=7994 RepID=A0A8B9HTF3_ASTMX
MIQDCKTAGEATLLSQEGQRMMKKIEKSLKPIVAAINGSCLSGGLEFAIACHYRVGTDSPPEVLQGLLPGAGGTQRLPKMIGLPSALELMLTGRNIQAEKAKRLGLVHQVVNMLDPGLNSPEEGTTEYLEKVAVDCACGIAKEETALTVENSGMQKIERYILTLEQTKRLYPAPLKIIKSIKLVWSRDQKLDTNELEMSSQSNALIGLYQGKVACKKNRFRVPEKKVKPLAILGAMAHLHIKHKVLQEVEAVIPPHCIFASKTSAVLITDIAEATPMLNEAVGVLQEGVNIKKLDLLTKSFGFPLGAASLEDEVGIDVLINAAEELGKAFGSRICGGNISGKGFYRILRAWVQRRAPVLWEPGHSMPTFNFALGQQKLHNSMLRCLMTED